jgi:GNAT superfamily N-acetyltransferase
MKDTQNTVTIERFDLSEKSKLLAFLGNAFAENPRQSDDRFWNWHFVESPHSKPEKMPVWIAKSGEKIAGQLATIPVVLNINGEKTEAVCILDFIVAPEFRRQGLGKRLVLAAEKSCPVMFCLITDRQHTARLLQGLDWAFIGNIPRYHKLLFPGNDVREIARLKLIREAVNLCFAPLRPRFGENLLTGGGGNLRLVEKFDSSFDNLWEESENNWSCAVRRDAKMLEWQFARQPEKNFDVIGYYENDKLLGYAVLFFRKKNPATGTITKAAISDICYHPKKPAETVDALLQAALQLAVERRAGGLVTDTTDVLIGERLRRFGFWHVKSPLMMMVKSPDRQDLLYNLKNWFLTRGDADISIFENPNL